MVALATVKLTEGGMSLDGAGDLGGESRLALHLGSVGIAVATTASCRLWLLDGGHSSTESASIRCCVAVVDVQLGVDHAAHGVGEAAR